MSPITPALLAAAALGKELWPLSSPRSFSVTWRAPRTDQRKIRKNRRRAHAAGQRHAFA